MFIFLFFVIFLSFLVWKESKISTEKLYLKERRKERWEKKRWEETDHHNEQNQKAQSTLRKYEVL